MTTETYLDLTYERGKGSKRTLRPKLLKLTDVTIPHRSRKKNKVKTKDRASTSVRERIYDDPAYTDDISHLANPMRRSSISGKPLSEHKSRSDASSSSLLARHQLTKELHQYVTGKQGKIKGPQSAAAATGSTAASLNYDCDSSSTDNEPLDPIKGSNMTRRVRSLERSLAITTVERVPNEKKVAQKRSSKQKRNLSLDNSRNLPAGHPHTQREAAVAAGKQGLDFENRPRKERSRKYYSEGGSTEVAQAEVSELEDVYSARSSAQDSAATAPAEAVGEATKVAIGKRFLRGEIGIKSFNYYLLKEGLKSSKKLVDKPRTTAGSGGVAVPVDKAEKRHSRSEENIYEEIFFKDIPSTVASSVTGALSGVAMSVASVLSDKDVHLPHDMISASEAGAADAFAECEICMNQCSKENCEFCLAQHGGPPVAGSKMKAQPQQSEYNTNRHQEGNSEARTFATAPAAHILEFQSYNPNNPGVYKMETTPVAITGDYNPILQFQQSSANTSTSATTTPSEQQQHQIYGGYYLPHAHPHAHANQRPFQTPMAGNSMSSHYAVGGSLLLAQVAGAGAAHGSATPPRKMQQQHYIVGYQNGGSAPGVASLQRLNTKSSSSSDSLPYHKYNTMARLEANVFAAPATGDLYYAVSGAPPLHPLMYAASRPIGGSQILVDPYDPQMYKSDSKASILSEYSLRSSDNSHRYGRHPNRRHGGRVSESSLFSVYSNSGQRRYYGSSESRFGYDCRRCSLDGVIGMGSGAGVPLTGAADKCSFSDNCRYECRNCDCSSNYFSSDFDDVYGSIARGGSSGIPRKTAAGTLPSSTQDEPLEPKESAAPPIEQHQQYTAPLDLKQNKYAQDFFKHVNDVKRSIYQSEMQRNNRLESSRRSPRTGSTTNNNPKTSPKRDASQEPRPEPVVTTLPLSRGRPAGAKPTPAPRTSLQSQTTLPTTSVPRDPTPSKRKGQLSGRREYPSLDRLVASSTGTVPKRHNRTVVEAGALSPKLTPKPRTFAVSDAGETGDRAAKNLIVAVVEQMPTKRHHRTSGSKAHQNAPGPSLRRKDIPVPPPPSPATYSDLQELKANMEGFQDDTKSRSMETEANESASNQKAKQLAAIQPKPVLEPGSAPLEDSGYSAKKAAAPTQDLMELSAAEMDDNDVFYDARSEDSGGGILPSEASDHSKKSSSDMATATQALADTIGIENQGKAAADSAVEVVESPPPLKPKPERLEQASPIADTPEGIAINIGSDDAESTKSLAEEDRPAPPTQLLADESQLCPNSRSPSPSSNPYSASPPLQKLLEPTTPTFKEEYEKRSKTNHDKKAPSQHVGPTCSEGQPATSNFTRALGLGPHTTNNTNAGNTSPTNIASNSVAELQFSCKTVGNTDSDSAEPAVSHSEPTLDAHVSAAAPVNPAQPRPLTRQDYACLDSSEAQSDDSHLTRDSITRESQNDELSSSTLEKLDVSTLPLPALPKRRRTRSRTSPSKHLQQRQQQPRHEAGEEDTGLPEAAVQQSLKSRQRAVTPESQKHAAEINTPKKNTSSQKQQRPQQQQHQQPPHLSAFQQYVAKRRESLEASNRSFNEKLEARRMHYHHMGGGSANGTYAASHLTTGSNGVPTYLFGEHFQGVAAGPGRKSISPTTNKEEIFLNKSGWVQVNTKRGTSKDDNYGGGYRRLNYGQQNGGAVIPDNGCGRPGIRAVHMDHGRRLDLARQSFIQQHQQQSSGMGISEPKFVGSKVEELIQRNEARLGGQSSREAALRPGYRIIDPQLANILNERPGFLPVKSPNDLDSPITPILSPPPAFQDNSRSMRHQDRPKSIRAQGPLPLPVSLQSQTKLVTQHPANVSVKGMVFSRSFEYDTRRPQPPDNYVETFSRSFDGNLSERPLNLTVLAGQRERSPNFSTLTGNSPNYLTKRESGGGSSGSLRSRDNSPKYLNPQSVQTTAFLNAAVKEAPPVYSVAATGSQAKYSPRSRHERTADRSKGHAHGRSRKSQFSRVGSAGPLAPHPTALNVGVSRFRSFDTSKSQRLNSCDSGARSDLSNDELDNEDGGLSEFLSASTQKFPKAGASTISISPFKMQRQRSLTPDRNESHHSSSSLRKQRSLTPESRSLTPEERRKKGSQLSLSAGSRQNSGSRSNTLETRKRQEDKTPPNISRSSSSSSYSGGDSHEPLNASTSSTVTASAAGPASNSSSHRRPMTHCAAKQAEQEHRIRRSRSLQLSERSPNRTHKSIVNVGAVPAQQQQQASTATYQQTRLLVGGSVFPPTIRASPAGSKMHANPKASANTSVRVRQNEADKARSFDFDYSNYNRSGSTKGSARSAHTSGSGGDSGSNQNLRVERESRSFDDDYREALLNNNNGSSGSASVSGLRFLQPATDSGHASSSRLRKSNSPINASGMEHSASRSPQSSGSSSNNLHQPPRQPGSPQSYGTRLCDHELTYDMLRKSPIMNFRRGDSSDYDLPVMIRNRETINSGGNSELNFMSNETRIYEHPTTVLKPQRSLRQSPGSRDDLTLDMAVGVGGDYIYRQAANQPRSSSNTTEFPLTTTTKSCSKTLDTCDYWPRCAACQDRSASGPVKRTQSKAVVSVISLQPSSQPHVVSLPVNKRPCVQRVGESRAFNSSWTFLCSGMASTSHSLQQTQPESEEDKSQKDIALRSSRNDRQHWEDQPAEVEGNNKCRTRSRCVRGERSRSLPSLTLRTPPQRFGTCGMPNTGNQGLRHGLSRGEAMKKLIIPTLMDTYGLIKFWDFDACPGSVSKSARGRVDFSMPATDSMPAERRYKWRPRRLQTQQMRAVSSPTLTEPLSVPPEQKSDESADMAATAVTGNSSSGNGGGSVGGGLGVLQMFKRTLNNFNGKNQLHITPLPSAATSTNVSKPKSSPTTPTVSITAPAAATTTATSESGPEGGDASSGKYRFGPLIWRTSKERRKTKFNRRDKCNSGDSGIQIELEQDEQYSRALTVGGQGGGAPSASVNGTSTSAESKIRAIRRTNSAKASSILGPFALKSKNAKHLNIGESDRVEREAPESLPTRSLSQPNGLETYGMGGTELEDSDSDSVTSHDDAVSYYPTIYAEVLYNFTAAGPQELGLERGMLIEILRKEVGPWWFGRIKKEDTILVEDILDPELGWFPKEFVRVIHCPETDIFFNEHRAAAADADAEADVEAEDAAEEGACGGDKQSIPLPVATFAEDADITVTTDQSNVTLIVIESPPNPMSASGADILLDHNAILRRSAVRELLETEANYVKLLAAICDGYLPAMSKRIDIFSPNSIRLIFSNITAIYKFQRKFLEALRRGIEQNQIAKVFLKMHKGFLCYSTYCNTYPRALIELETYDRVKDARTILENCRESENLAELPLSAHLLAPVQRICRYPLHLNEIIKSALESDSQDSRDVVDGAKPLATEYEQLDVSEMDIPDSRDTVNRALEAMRGITEAVNEGKRHSETIARHQSSFQNFKGPPLHLHSARFFLQVDATRQKPNLWNNSYTLFLFDNQLVYCKRDIIKRSHFIYKGRIFLDRCRVVNVRDGKMFGHTIKNSLRIYCESREKWYDFSFRSANRKHRFLNTLALERQFGGKALYVQEMAGFEYNYEERCGDFSDQSDYEAQDFEAATGATSASGESSVPESPAKSSSRLCETLPKKSLSRDGISSAENSQMLSTTSTTGSLGRRPFGKWFRKPKSTNCTPSQSPTHKPGFDADATLTEARVAAMELAAAEADATLLVTDSSSA